jgi:single-strand DNA-binding protein
MKIQRQACLLAGRGKAMTSQNVVILTGKIATPPRRHFRPDGSPVIQFPLELNDSENRFGKALHGAGSAQASRNLINIVALGEWADSKLELLQSGLHLRVVGQLNQRHWQTPEGKKRTRMEVIATDLQGMEETSPIPHLPIDKMD